MTADSTKSAASDVATVRCDCVSQQKDMDLTFNPRHYPYSYERPHAPAPSRPQSSSKRSLASLFRRSSKRKASRDKAASEAGQATSAPVSVARDTSSLDKENMIVPVPSPIPSPKAEDPALTIERVDSSPAQADPPVEADAAAEEGPIPAPLDNANGKKPKRIAMRTFICAAIAAIAFLAARARQR